MKLNPIACSFEINQTNGRVHLFPFGRFFSADGRPEGKEGWYVDDSNGYLLAEEINSLSIDLMIDYEHQTIYIEKNGKPNPAAGWIKKAEYIPGKGLYADIDWTDEANQQIKDKKYRYLSPLFIADETGKVIKLLNAALTNRPALHNLDEALAFSENIYQKKDKQMLKLLQQLFGAENATEDEIKQKLTALSAAKGTSTVALSDVYAELENKKNQVVALSAKVNQTPDPAKYVALSDMQAVQTELNQLKAEVNQSKVDGLVTQALSDGRLLPAQKEWAEKLGKSDIVALSDYLKTVAPNPAFAGGPQTKGDPNNNVVALSESEKAAAKALGMSESEFRKAHKEIN